jgi:hypothetical protein
MFLWSFMYMEMRKEKAFQVFPGTTVLFAVVVMLGLLLNGCQDIAGGNPSVDQNAADDFKNNEAVREALEIDVGTINLAVTAEDLTAIEAKIEEALAAYNEVSQSAKEALAGEKAKLDALKDKVGSVKTAHGFRKAHRETLGTAPDAITGLIDAGALLPGLENALEEMNALSDPVKELLADEIALLENLKAKIAEIEASARTITFDSHGGTELDAVKADMGTPVEEPKAPVLESYVFLGWYSAETGGTLYTWPHTLNANVTMHAQWKLNTLAAEITLWSNDDREILSSDTNIRISKSGAGYPANFTVEVTSAYTGIQWTLGGLPISAGVPSITINAADYAAVKNYILGVIVYKDGIPYSNEIHFTVVN